MSFWLWLRCKVSKISAFLLKLRLDFAFRSSHFGLRSVFCFRNFCLSATTWRVSQKAWLCRQSKTNIPSSCFFFSSPTTTSSNTYYQKFFCQWTETETWVFNLIWKHFSLKRLFLLLLIKLNSCSLKNLILTLCRVFCSILVRKPILP
jgi:hypothetical protein